MVKTLPSSARGVGPIPGGGTKIPHALMPKNQNMNNTVANSINTLKMVHMQKNKKIFKKVKKKSWTQIHRLLLLTPFCILHSRLGGKSQGF